MTDLMQLSFMKQRNVEQFFAASIFIRPLETIDQCGWFDTRELTHEGIKEYWKLVKQRISPGMDQQQAAEISVQAAFEAGIHLDVMQWVNDLPWQSVPQSYAVEISRKQYLIRMAQSCNRMAISVASQDDQEVKRIVEEMFADKRSGIMTVPHALDVAEQFEKIVREGKRSVDTFIPPIDSSVGGLERQTLSIVAARPSMGKTALAWQIARNVAQSGSLALFFSLEMSSTNLWARAACPCVGTTWRDVRSGNMDKKQSDDLLAESYALAAQYSDRLRIIDSSQTTETIWRTVANLKPDLVIVDHLRLVQDKHDSEVKRLGMITEKLKNMSKSTNAAVLLAVQLNRGVEGRSNKRPMLSDLRDSGEIEENADLIMMIYRDDYYQDKTKPLEKSLTEIWVRKFRDGPRDTLMKLIFDTRNEWFDPVKDITTKLKDYTV